MKRMMRAAFAAVHAAGSCLHSSLRCTLRVQLVMVAALTHWMGPASTWGSCLVANGLQ